MRLVPVCYAEVSGGAEHYLTTLFGRLHGLGHSVHLVGSVPGWPATGLPSTDVGFGPKWAKRSMLTGPSRLPRERVDVDRAVRGLPADVFHAQFKREQIGLTDLLARRAPVVWTEHGTLPDGRRGRLLTAAYARAARRVAAIVCVSEAVAVDVRRAVGRHVRVEVIPNAIDTVAAHVPTDRERRAARSALGVPDERTKILGWVGRLSPGKLPELAAEVGRHFDGVMLIAGEDVDGHVPQETAASRVRYVGHLADPGVLYRAADAFLFTSAGGEGLPYTLLEAAAHGLPIVVNAGSGADRLLGAVGVVGADEPRALAALAHSAAAERPSRRVRDWALAHDILPWAERHAAVMASVIDGSSGLEPASVRTRRFEPAAGRARRSPARRPPARGTGRG